MPVVICRKNGYWSNVPSNFKTSRQVTKIDVEHGNTTADPKMKCVSSDF